jgi:IPT/TIG domain
METRARTRPLLRRAGFLAALTALLVPAVAGTATADAAKRKKPRSPVVTKITPKTVFVGETLTIRGRHFVRGINKNTVAFKRRGAKAVFVKAEKGTTKLLQVVLPKSLEKVLPVVNGTPVATKLQVRVLSKRFGKRFTSRSSSPLVGPERPPAPPTPPAADPDADCDGDGQVNRVDGDDDNDLLLDEKERSLKLDACAWDSDRDQVSDGYEHFSARDLNDDEHQEPNDFLHAPERKPYPNALDGTDGGLDHDGDSLTLKEEYDLWKLTGAPLSPMSYSAGEQYSVSARDGAGRRTPTLAAVGYAKQDDFLNEAAKSGYGIVALADVGTDLWDPQADWWETRQFFNLLDIDRSGGAATPAGAGAPSEGERVYYDNGNGYLDDGERDEDADGLTNFDETRGCMVRGHWDGLYDKETPFPLGFADVSHVDADSDGDGVLDGADDQDHDDVPNLMECSRLLASGLAADSGDAEEPRDNLPAKGFVNPFNPCLPHIESRTCPQYVELGGGFAPFKPEDDIYYFIKN